VIAIVEPVAEAKGVRVDLVVARELPAIITDGRHVRQILMNLMTNAIKFTERGSVTIVAKLADQPGMISIAIEDTGIGIADADLGRIFDEFEQVRPSARGDSIARGTGLGLTVSRKLARLLGGDVSVDSQIGTGSRFTLILPLQSTPPRVPDTPSEGRARVDDASPADSADAFSAAPNDAAESGRRP
jgi:signal transduction histidine kinase